MKDMVKRSGENISAAEVEDCLCKLPGVLMAAVVPVPDESRREEVKAFVQLEDGVKADALPPSSILAHCAEHLTAFKVPRYLAYIDELPLTAGNDKVAKPQLTAGVTDPRQGAYDRMDDVWR
jgi:acyl-coenzyme A synthetase/AMP-(fatty) acid ligase